MRAYLPQSEKDLKNMTVGNRVLLARLSLQLEPLSHALGLLSEANVSQQHLYKFREISYLLQGIVFLFLIVAEFDSMNILRQLWELQIDELHVLLSSQTRSSHCRL
jgi:hypothetical protein